MDDRNKFNCLTLLVGATNELQDFKNYLRMNEEMLDKLFRCESSYSTFMRGSISAKECLVILSCTFSFRS